ncbi:DUF7931 domain-containing protein [Chitinimonas koreensis]|uniref:DUF7931 domain-containing protein n=1 Tax=Chitinimonas koreensis TaxID=356302 RepID=UPI0004224502|nr:hypothetical protein [Chitinimonas koreensis]QNM94727.1 hypothetical protein H9L41_12325 [Chitinimonas koreensis]
MTPLLFDTLEQYRAQVLVALAGAERTLDWFDPDLAGSGAEAPACAEALHAQLAGKQLRLRLLLHDEAWFVRHCPRLAALMQVYGHLFELRLTGEADREAGEPFLLTERAVVRRFHADSPRGEAAGPGRAHAACRQRFGDLWMQAVPAGAGRRLFI